MLSPILNKDEMDLLSDKGKAICSKYNSNCENCPLYSDELMYIGDDEDRHVVGHEWCTMLWTSEKDINEIYHSQVKEIKNDNKNNN